MNQTMQAALWMLGAISSFTAMAIAGREGVLRGANGCCGTQMTIAGARRAIAGRKGLMRDAKH